MLFHVKSVAAYVAREQGVADHSWSTSPVGCIDPARRREFTELHMFAERLRSRRVLPLRTTWQRKLARTGQERARDDQERARVDQEMELDDKEKAKADREEVAAAQETDKLEQAKAARDQGRPARKRSMKLKNVKLLGMSGRDEALAALVERLDYRQQELDRLIQEEMMFAEAKEITEDIAKQVRALFEGI